MSSGISRRTVRLCVLLLLLTAVPVEAQTEVPLEEVARVLAEHKQRAEQGVVRLKSRFGPSDTVLIVAEQLYGDAHIAFDGLIAYLQASLQSRDRPIDSPAFRGTVGKAMALSELFADYSREVLRPDSGPATVPRTVIIEAAAKAAGALADAIVSLWKASWERTDARRARVRDDIGRLRWRSFGDIK
jgi:hypothetical protein